MRKNGRILNREILRTMLQAAQSSGDYRFARQLALAWLSAFPGDMDVSRDQARAILAEGRPGLVVPALDLLIRKDPECLESYQILAQATQPTDAARFRLAATHAYAFGAPIQTDAELSPWGDRVAAAVRAVSHEQWSLADRLVQDALRAAPDLQLTAVLHLKLSRATQAAVSTLQLAQLYQSRWPECLTVNLILAEARMEMGQEQDAVHLLHQCVSNDAAGQTARRLWGENHPYRSLWVEDMVINFDQPIPANVAARMGWNQLAGGQTAAVLVLAGDTSAIDPQSDPQSGGPAIEFAPVVEVDMPAGEAAQTQRQSGETQPPQIVDPQPESSEILLTDVDQGLRNSEDPDAVTQEQPPMEKAHSKAGSHSKVSANPHQPIQNEFDRLARKIRKGGIAHSDGRFPVYVLFTTRSGLVKQYGPQTAAVVDLDLRRLAGVLRQKAEWDALVFYPDDADCAGAFGIQPVTEMDPWKLKLALVDLDKALARRGEMIGALLIVGGDELVPFHRLPNPTDDNDHDVPSDNPYGTRDSNYFITEWPVGRIPTESGPDAGCLLEKLRTLQHVHSKAAAKSRMKRDGYGFGWISTLWSQLLGKQFQPSLGYTAAVWRRSSLAVFRPIGAPHTVLTSPPEKSGSLDPKRVTRANLGYYNLHGTEDSAAWYGQRDPAEKDDGPDYPVALRPEDLPLKGAAPQVIFSEACYGAHVFGKTDNQSLALKFLSVGTQAVVASTCVAYGSVTTPLIAADLLGNLFWRHLKAGRPVGDALSQARLDLAREMNRRQGYLDGEDQKTLISFVLYGDPLASFKGVHAQAKGVQRVKQHIIPKTVCDRQSAGEPAPVISHEVMNQVKALVSEYLPGADLENIHLSRQHAACNGKNHQCPTAELTGRMKSPSEVGRLVVTMSKQITVAQHVHRHFVRITLNETGQAVKLSISR